MDWKAALVSFLLVFGAEVGDKTQLMVMAMATRSRAPVAVFLGAAAALAASSLIAVWAGEFFFRAVPVKMVRLLSGLLFLGIGAVMVFKSMR